VTDPRSHPTEVTICTGRQGGIHSIKNPQQQCGQYLICSILQLGVQLQKQGVKIDLYYVPAQTGITGNEIEHTYARMATSNPGRHTVVRLGPEHVVTRKCLV
jgi:hypothetical protein